MGFSSRFQTRAESKSENIFILSSQLPFFSPSLRITFLDLLSIDIFSKNIISTAEISTLLYSIACCHECTMEVFDTLKKREATLILTDSSDGMDTSFRISKMSDIASLLCRYYMKNRESYDYILSFTSMQEEMQVLSKYGAWDGKRGSAYLDEIDCNLQKDVSAPILISHFTLKHQISLLLTSCGAEVFKCSITNNRNVMAMSLHAIMQGISFASPIHYQDVRKALRFVRRRYGQDIYYGQLMSLNPNISRDLISSLARGYRGRMEDMVMLSLDISNRLREEVTDAGPNLDVGCLWYVPYLILKRYCKTEILKKDDGSSVCSVLYKGVTYHMSIEIDIRIMYGDVIPFYKYSNGTRIRYRSLLYIITCHFIWEYDREYILDLLDSYMFIDCVDNTPYYGDPILRLLVSIHGV